VLIVEDDLDLLAILETVLQNIDPMVELDWATSADNALIQLKAAARTSKQSYDLIVADIFLNGEATGIDLWNKCHEVYPEVPVVIMSSLPVHKYLSILGEQTISPPFLAKPFELGECKQLFREMFKYAQKNRRFLSSDMRSSV
jgi:DNA-binding NtrC family response regulator